MHKNSLRNSAYRIPGVRYTLRLIHDLALLPRITRDLRIKQEATQKNLHAKIEEALNELKRSDSRLSEHISSVDQRIKILSSMFESFQATARPNPQKKKDEEGATLFADNHELDQFYLDFENRFRGTEKEIHKKQSGYIPRLKETNPTKDAPVLDIGCGRGEFLELLKQNNIPPLGLDLNDKMIERVKEKGHDAVAGDATSYLKKRAEGSLSGITGFHLVEHIPFGSLLKMFDQCFRCLKSRGVVIFETPNPENLIVGACNFNNDPSHLKPIPPEVLRFTLESRGFVDCQIIRLHPMKDLEALNENDELTREIAGRLFGPQDYSIIGKKP